MAWGLTEALRSLALRVAKDAARLGRHATAAHPHGDLDVKTPLVCAPLGATGRRR